MWLFPFLLTTLWSQSVQGWYVVFKVGGQGVGTYSSLIELWSAYDVLNDDQAAIVQDTYRVKDMPSYKSNIVRSQWNKVKMTKIGMYKDGQESAYVVFNCTNTDIETWFSASRIIQSSYTDLNIPKASCSLHNNATDRTFQVISTDEGADCSNFGGWMMAVDDGGSSSCHWEYGHRKPFFLYSTGNSAAQFIDGSDVADSFVIFVGLTCRSCVHVSHDMDKVPSESVPGIETYLRQMEDKDCLSTTMKPKDTGTCDTSQEASTGKAKCTTTQVMLVAKGMDKVAEDATLRIHFYGRNCTDLREPHANGCVNLNTFEPSQRDSVTEILDVIVNKWTNRSYEGEICYDDNSEPFMDLGLMNVPELKAKPKLLEP